ncbi:PQQ-binding-like beta-propeller repeat protein [Alterisphingorhabdus coralli]|uniref:PQQ-binding-like beta-propeller repeat protein n=1 Tax=Alterisphingorhabdus coralli TaxID=3071408 RepID=A0AA97I231_9SPHN|nr:PQQ-binding-like beta-propeller repeat protein [Parasphingorhabdus sp. SCSIO 66989]WOE75960.1 PQQ-binding-like beta-propeller repeat protein [Parasphingorhabdus sp. SCSIO 66989]
MVIQSFKAALPAAMALILAGCGVLGGEDKPKQTPTIGNRTAILTNTESGAEVDPSISGLSVLLPAPVRNPNWAQPGGNASKSVGHVALGDSLSEAWTAQVAGSSTRERLASAPVSANGKVYVEDTEGQIHAFDLATGSRLWQSDLSIEGDGRQSVFGGGVTVDGNRVYATTGFGEVAVLNADNGEVLWRVKPAGPLRGSPTVAFNSVYVMTQDNQLYSLSATDGSVQWSRQGTAGQAGVFGVAAPAAGQGTVIAGYSSGELNAYRYENGRELWSDALARTRMSTSVATLSDIDADPIIDRGRVYALGEGGRMAAYELSIGQRIWEINIAGISTPAIAGEWLFVMTDDARMLCVARSTGKVRWIAQLQKWRDEKDKKGAISWIGPVLAGNRLIAASSEGEIAAISPSEGAINILFDLKKPVTVPPIVVDNTLILLDDSGRVSAYR